MEDEIKIMIEDAHARETILNFVYKQIETCNENDVI